MTNNTRTPNGVSLQEGERIIFCEKIGSRSSMGAGIYDIITDRGRHLRYEGYDGDITGGRSPGGTTMEMVTLSNGARAVILR